MSQIWSSSQKTQNLVEIATHESIGRRKQKALELPSEWGVGGPEETIGDTTTHERIVGTGQAFRAGDGPMALGGRSAEPRPLDLA